MKKQNGVTLIALVITIVVLLILAGVSIQMVLGDNGILTNAREASKQTKEKEKVEYVQNALAALEMEALAKNDDTWHASADGKEYFEEQIKNYGASAGTIEAYGKDTTTGKIKANGTVTFDGKEYNWAAENGAVTVTPKP